MALAKRFTMAYSEHHFIQFRLEAFNVFNHPVWVRRTETSWRVRHFRGRPPMPRIRDSAFRSTTLPVRQLQLALKYSF